MESIEAIELRLWSYIDGDCDAAEKLGIAALITTDPVWKEKYAELLAVHEGLQAMESEHTSLRFSKNVMEAIADVKVARATNSYINPWVIRGVISFSVALIVCLIGYLLSNVERTTGSGEHFDYGSIFNGNFVLCVLLLTASLIVAIIDTLLRRKKATS